MDRIRPAFLEAAQVREIRDKADAFLKGVDDGTKESAAFDDFVTSLRDSLRTPFRDAWLTMQQERRKDRIGNEARADAESSKPIPPVEPANDEFRTLPESAD